MPPDPTDSSPLATVSDLDAIADVCRGNREMFEVIVRRYNQLLFRVGMSYLRNHALTEDAMQNTYVKAFLHLGDFGRDAAFSTWITRIMINECLMMLRRQRNRRETLVDPTNTTPTVESAALAWLPDRPESEPLASERVSLKEMKALLEEAIAALPRKYRAVYMLREVQQLSTAETAAALGVSTAGVKVDLHRARERLKTELLKSSAAAELFTYHAFFCDRMTARVLGLVLALSPGKRGSA